MSVYPVIHGSRGTAVIFVEVPNRPWITQDGAASDRRSPPLCTSWSTWSTAATRSSRPVTRRFAHFDAGSGRWGLVDAHGIALGLLPDMAYVGSGGVLRTGDALLLYTDGLVEVPGPDLSVGIDKLLGAAERLAPRGFAGGGPLLVNRVAAGSSDDRGLVLLWRDR